MIGGFRPLFRALDPEKVNNIAQSIITIFQGQGGTINDILDQTASLTSALADKDQAIGEVIKNLNTVLDTTVKHQKQFDETIKNFEKLITGLKNREDPIASSVANISDAAGTIADLLADNRPLLQSASPTSRPSCSRWSTRRRAQRHPAAANTFQRIGRAAVSTVTSSTSTSATSRSCSTACSPAARCERSNWHQPTGRCTPQ